MTGEETLFPGWWLHECWRVFIHPCGSSMSTSFSCRIWSSRSWKLNTVVSSINPFSKTSKSDLLASCAWCRAFSFTNSFLVLLSLTHFVVGQEGCLSPKLEPQTIETPFERPVLWDLPIEKIWKEWGGAEGGDEHWGQNKFNKVGFSQPPCCRYGNKLYSEGQNLSNVCWSWIVSWITQEQLNQTCSNFVQR